MVWLDERPEKITGRAPQDTIGPVGPGSPTVQPPYSGSAPMVPMPSTKHLRASIWRDDTKELHHSRRSCSFGRRPTNPTSSHETVLFRHADAKCHRADLAGVDAAEMARFMAQPRISSSLQIRTGQMAVIGCRQIGRTDCQTAIRAAEPRFRDDGRHQARARAQVTSANRWLSA